MICALIGQKTFPGNWFSVFRCLNPFPTWNPKRFFFQSRDGQLPNCGITFQIFFGLFPVFNVLRDFRWLSKCLIIPSFHLCRTEPIFDLTNKSDAYLGLFVNFRQFLMRSCSLKELLWKSYSEHCIWITIIKSVGNCYNTVLSL